jgi:manganese oxidase
MMTGTGQFGPIEMGGMFSVFKVRDGLASNDYSDPGWYKHPPGTVAYELKGEPAPEPKRKTEPARTGRRETEVKVIKPGGRKTDGHQH